MILLCIAGCAGLVWALRASTSRTEAVEVDTVVDVPTEPPADAPKSWRVRNRSVLLVAAAVGVFALCGFSIVPIEGGRVERWEADLNEQLPDGSSWEQAEAWFASHGIKPGYIADSNRRIGLATKIPNSTLIENAHIRIELYFDDNNRLRERVIYRFVYSL